jgi:DNA repair protein RadC
VQIGTFQEAAALLGPLFAGVSGEKLAVLHLDRARRLLALEERDAESEESVLLSIRDIIARALALDARGLVIAHNHPSGDPNPSRADIRATRRLAETADALDIRLHDHLIFAGADCRSFRELGLL